MAPDRRFFAFLGPVALRDLAALAGGSLGPGAEPDLPIHSVAPLEAAGDGQIAFCAGTSHARTLARTGAAAVVAAGSEAAQVPAGCALVLADRPQAAFAAIAARLHAPLSHLGAAAIDPQARLEPEVRVGPGVSIGPAAWIGRGTTISAGAAIGPGVTIGRNGYIGANAVIGFALLGDRVRVLGGAVIGEAGFGATLGERGLIDIPQLGRVILQDGVTVGAGTCIDRGALSDTVVGENTKIDNLAQIGHNVVIGRNCLLVAHTGISGSVIIGDGCVFGGRAGTVDHIQIGDGARIAGGSGVTKDVPAGESWGGYPARPLARWKRETAWLSLRAARRKERGGP